MAFACVRQGMSQKIDVVEKGVGVEGEERICLKMKVRNP